MQTDNLVDPLIFVKSFKTAANAAEVLRQKHYSMKKTAYSDALWEGYWALREEGRTCAKAAKERGQLLFLGGVS